MNKLFLTLSLLMGFVVLISNFLVQFPVKYYGLENILTYGAFSYPIAFLITDLANRSFGKIMLKRTGGSIVNVGSMSGIISNKPQQQVHYNASKAAVHMATKSLAGEWATKGIRVNAVAPTYIDTDMTPISTINKEWLEIWLDMTPMKRVGECDEIASAVLFLGSNASSLITGSILVVDAGYTIW